MSILIGDMFAEENWTIGGRQGSFKNWTNNDNVSWRLTNKLLKLLIVRLNQFYKTPGFPCVLTILVYVPVKWVFFTHLMDITVSNSITCNLSSISFCSLFFVELLYNRALSKRV